MPEVGPAGVAEDGVDTLADQELEADLGTGQAPGGGAVAALHAAVRGRRRSASWWRSLEGPLHGLEDEVGAGVVVARPRRPAATAAGHPGEAPVPAAAPAGEVAGSR